jgi:hypothetical protein
MQDEKAKNTQTTADSQVADYGAQALMVLKGLYKRKGAAMPRPCCISSREPPVVYDAPHKSIQPENGGIWGMLEVIESDFARLASDTKAMPVVAMESCGAVLGARRTVG